MDNPLEASAPEARPVCPFTECPFHGKPVVRWEYSPNPLAVLVGEAPGAEEEETGWPFVGKSGRELSMYLERFTGFPRRRFTIGNLVCCRPPKNRDPGRKEIGWCENRLIVELEELRPEIVGAVGLLSSRWFLGGRPRMEKVHGMVFERNGIIVVPMYHPAAGLHSPRRMKDIIEDFRVLGEVIRGERQAPVRTATESRYDYRAY